MTFPRGTELIILLILLILVFGWKRLPDAARSLGRSARVFKSEVEEMKKDGKEDQAAGATRADGVDEPYRPQQQVSPPPPVQSPTAQPPYQQPSQPSQPSFQQPQQPAPQAQPRTEDYRAGEYHPDDPTRPVA